MDGERKSIRKICLVMFCCFVFLAYWFPYTGDDWTWGSSLGMERLRTFFAGYNGRYAGNIVVLLLTRSKLLDVVVMAASFSMVCILSYEYANDKSQASLLMALSLFLLMPKGMWAQVVAWTAGFSNYVPSALISAAYLVHVKEITEAKLSDYRDTRKYSLWWFILGFCGALFVESITVFNICLVVAAIIYMFLKFRKFRWTNMAFLGGSVIGACAMFSNSTYDRIAQGEDYYRYIPDSFQATVNLAIAQAGEILNFILSDNLLFCAIVTILLLTLAVWNIRTKGRKKRAILPAVFHGGSLLLLWYKDAVSVMLAGWFALSEPEIRFVPIVISLLYILSILAMVLCFVEKGRRFRMLLPFYCVAVSLAPLLFVHPVGPRCVFIGYLFMIVFTVDLFGYTRKQILPKEKGFSRLIGLVVVAQLLFYFHIFYPIHHYDSLRLDYIKQQTAEGKTEVMMCDLPNTDYLWISTPFNEGWINKYKLFYGLQEDLQLIVIPYYELESLLNSAF